MFRIPVYILLLVSAPFAFAQEAVRFEIDMPVDVEGAGPYVFKHRAMGTEFTVTIYDENNVFSWEGAYAISEEAFARVNSLERDISSWISSSNTSKINTLASTRWVTASPDVWKLFEHSYKLFNETNGAFDVTVGPLLKYWDKPNPDPEQLPAILEKTGMKKVQLDTEKHAIRFKSEGMNVSFGGIGKGLAIDEIAEVFRAFGVKTALISGGDSSIFALGAPPGQEFWRIGIHNPYNDTANLDTVFLRDQSLSTSACYHHEADAIHGKPCEILDPRTGRQVRGMLSATIVAPSGLETDALSTSFYVMGVDQVRHYIEKHPDIRAIIVEYPEDGAPKPVRIGSFGTESDKGH